MLHSMGWDRCIIICIHHYSILQSVFTALKILCARPIHPLSPTPNPWQPLIFFFFLTLSIVLPFPRCMYMEPYRMQPFHIGSFHLVICIYGFSVSLHGLIAHFFLVLYNVLSSRCTTVLFVHSRTEGHLGCFQVFKIMNKASINICVQVFV